jgi:hypothetical protein
MYRGSRKLSIAAAMAVVGALVLSTVALAAGPVKGAKYKGKLNPFGAPVSFKVSANGKTVTKMKVDTYPPNKCGAGGPTPKQSSKPATIKHGKFKVRLTYTYSATVHSTYTVTGTFLKHRKEKGVFFYKSSKFPHCNGNFRYTATAQ